MSDNHEVLESYSIKEWVEESPEEQKEFREAVHTILVAIAKEPNLKADMVIKGGILLAIRYHSHRYTKDIDFSTQKMPEEIDPDVFKGSLNHGLIETVEYLDYDLDCRVQSCKIQPANRPDATFPELKVTVGYAYKGTRKHKKLQAGQSPTCISIDYSINEPTPNIEHFDLSENENLIAYSLTDLIAEKLRAVIQQAVRDRTRRQDIFDLHILIEKYPDLDNIEKGKILRSLKQKAASRDIEVKMESFRNEELKRRSAAEYPKLAQEVEGELPDFDIVFNVVQAFYESLPWQ